MREVKFYLEKRKGIKRLVLYCLLIMASLMKAQQNLVPDGSFELLLQCPVNCVGATTSTLAIGWGNPNIGSSDLFHACDTQICSGWNTPCHGVPSNCWGWQNSQDGSGYAGFVAWAKPSSSQNNVREYLQAQLVDSLRANKSYCTTFYVSFADSLADYATSRVAAYLSNTAINSSTQYLLAASPQIQNPFNNFLMDSQGWHKISGLFTASGGENFITIGNFFDDNNTDTLFTSQRFSDRSYYYLDNVSVTEYASAFAGVDTIVCSGTKLNRNLTSSFGSIYNWTVINGDPTSMDSSMIASPNFSPTVTTTYALQKTQCGIITTDTLIINVPNSYPAVASKDTSICLGDSVLLIALNNCGWCNHGWNSGTPSLQLIVSPSVPTQYIFTQTDSCRSYSDSTNVFVGYCQSPIFIIPNVFTPNADDINDVWLPIIKNPISVQNYELIIYDRWGIEIFKTDKIDSGWDGHTTAGVLNSSGTYYFVIRYMDSKTKREVRDRGFLTVIR